MPPEISRAPLAYTGWQQAATSNNSKRHLNSQRPTQPTTNTSAIHPSQPDVSLTTQQAEELVDTTIAPQSFNEHNLHLHSSQFDGQGIPSSAEHPSQYLQGSYLTPDYGSDLPFSDQSTYTSPGLYDNLWQPSYSNEGSLDDLVSDSTWVNAAFSNLDQTGDLQGIVSDKISPTSIEPHSATPRMSATATSTQLSTQLHTISPHLIPVNMNADKSKRAYDSEDDMTEQYVRNSRSSSNLQYQHTAGSSFHQGMHPTVTVSTYNRGDSPARTELPLARSLSKRSQSSRLSDHTRTISAHEAESIEPESSNSRLMPPDQYADPQWSNEDEEDDGRRGGVAPVDRSADTIASINDMDKQNELDENRAGVEKWLAASETGSPPIGGIQRNVSRNRSRKERIRSRSTGARVDRHGAPVLSDSHIPGPGATLDVDSENDYSEEGSSYVPSDEYGEETPESPPADVKPVEPITNQSYFPPVNEESIAPEDDEPLPRQFYRRAPWQDAARFPGTINEPGQPATSNHAIVQYDQQAAKFETASRAATWGTRRRLSESEVSAIVDGSKVRHLSLSNKARDRGNSMLNRARTVLRRSSSNVKKSKEHLQRQPSPPTDTDQVSMLERDSIHTATSPIQQINRQYSWGKPKSPPLPSTSSAFMAMTGHLAAVGGSGVGNSALSANVDQPERPKSPFAMLKRSRSRSEIPKTTKATPGLADMWKGYGGPPVSKLASPMQPRTELPEPNQVAGAAGNNDDDMDDDNDDDVLVKMELPVLADNIIPNLDGFRTHAKQLNPRLAPYLAERIAQDQVRRYKKLCKTKIDHTRSVQLKQQCSSGSFCKDLGGKPKILPPRTSAKDANINYAQFKVGNGGDSDGEEPFTDGGVVTPALFPQGIPLPPATHLPAEFECPLCFQVKKFQKPSDWTKHVHEDVQPFSCTFPNCPEPKSFKRKADWVRHENERHRHLEWWKCKINDCNHICYRKDNFVQHLVREHKMTEPKAKNQRPAANKARANPRNVNSLDHETDDFWATVEDCRSDTTHTPRSEPCKFCGNICTTWKKLSVHVGKHMEQIAMPVLDLVAKRQITVDTIISPIDPPSQRMGQASTLDAAMLHGNYDALSPYSATVYHSSSAGQSPAPVNTGHVQGNGVGQAYYDPAMMPNGSQPMTSSMDHFGGGNVMAPAFSYPSSYEVVNGSNFIPLQHQAAFTQQPAAPNVPAPYHTQQVPRSQAMTASFGNLNVDTVQASMYAHEHYYPNSAPGASYMDDYGNGLHHANGLHSPHHAQAGNLHSPVGNHANGNNYIFPHAQNGSNGNGYY